MSSNKAEGNATISFVNRQKHDNLSAIVNKGIVCQMIIKNYSRKICYSKRIK